MLVYTDAGGPCTGLWSVRRWSSNSTLLCESIKHLLSSRKPLQLRTKHQHGRTAQWYGRAIEQRYRDEGGGGRGKTRLQTSLNAPLMINSLLYTAFPPLQNKSAELQRTTEPCLSTSLTPPRSLAQQAWKASSTATQPMRLPVKSHPHLSHKLPQHRHCLPLPLHPSCQPLLLCPSRHRLLRLRQPDHPRSLQQSRSHPSRLISTVRLSEST